MEGVRRRYWTRQKRVTLMERIAANLRRTGLPNFCARDLAMPRRAPYFPHLLPNLITDHKPFVSRECVETAIDALVANDGGSRRWRKDVVCTLDRLSDRTVPTSPRFL